MSKSNYLIVCHTWFMDSKGFHEKILVNVTSKEAKAEAAIMEKEHKDSFCKSEAKEFLIPNTIMVVKDS